MPAMAIHIGGVALPGPSDLLDAARALTGWGAEATEVLADLPVRAAALLGEVERLLAKINAVTDRADVLITKVDAVTTRAEASVGRGDEVTGGAEQLLAGAGDLSGRARELLELYQPLAIRAAPLATRFVEELSEQEVLASIRLVDQLPKLTEHLERDIMPILATLDHLGPDITELLDVVKDLRRAVDSMPGIGMLRRRRPVEPE
jgi:hypothetical protein